MVPPKTEPYYCINKTLLKHQKCFDKILYKKCKKGIDKTIFLCYNNLRCKFVPLAQLDRATAF